MGAVTLDLQTGPYLACGAFGKYRNNGNTGSKYFDSWKRFDWGWNFGAGVDIDNFYAGLGFDLGFYDLSDHNNNWKARTVTFQINVGYNF